MNRLVVCAITVLAVTVAACSADQNTAGQDAGLNNPFSSIQIAVDSSPVTLYVIRNPADTIPKSDTVHYKKVPYYVADSAVDRTPAILVEPSGDTVSNGLDNVNASFNPGGIAELDGNGQLVGDTLGTTVLTYTFTDYNHNRAQTSVNIPITVRLASPVPNRVHFSVQTPRHVRIRVVH